jgi:hypothetical protein
LPNQITIFDFFGKNAKYSSNSLAKDLQFLATWENQSRARKNTRAARTGIVVRQVGPWEGEKNNIEEFLM